MCGVTGKSGLETCLDLVALEWGLSSSVSDKPTLSKKTKKPCLPEFSLLSLGDYYLKFVKTGIKSVGVIS
jgi:hypothetical protein